MKTITLTKFQWWVWPQNTICVELSQHNPKQPIVCLFAIIDKFNGRCDPETRYVFSCPSIIKTIHYLSFFAISDKFQWWVWPHNTICVQLSQLNPKQPIICLSISNNIADIWEIYCIWIKAHNSLLQISRILVVTLVFWNLGW